jgi:hypothetical protein
MAGWYSVHEVFLFYLRIGGCIGRFASAEYHKPRLPNEKAIKLNWRAFLEKTRGDCPSFEPISAAFGHMARLVEFQVAHSIVHVDLKPAKKCAATGW